MFAIRILFPLQFFSRKIIHSFAEILFSLSQTVKSIGYSGKPEHSLFIAKLYLKKKKKKSMTEYIP